MILLRNLKNSPVIKWDLHFCVMFKGSPASGSCGIQVWHIKRYMYGEISIWSVLDLEIWHNLTTTQVNKFCHVIPKVNWNIFIIKKVIYYTFQYFKLCFIKFDIWHKILRYLTSKPLLNLIPQQTHESLYFQNKNLWVLTVITLCTCINSTLVFWALPKKQKNSLTKKITLRIYYNHTV